MRSVLQLRDTASKERVRADSLRKEAQKHRDKINSLQMNTDPKISQAEMNEAQKLEERAAQHDQTALQMEQEAATLESQALEIERKEQELQVSTQATIDKLEGQKKALRGEG